MSLRTSFKDFREKVKQKLNPKKTKTKEEIDAEFFNSPEYEAVCGKWSTEQSRDPDALFDVKATRISSETVNGEDRIREHIIG